MIVVLADGRVFTNVVSQIVDGRGRVKWFVRDDDVLVSATNAMVVQDVPYLNQKETHVDP